MRVRSCLRSFLVAWTGGSPNRSSRRRGGTPWRCWSCRGVSAQGSWRGALGCPARCRCPERIESSFLRRLEALPEDTRRLLLVAAAEPTGDPALLWRAAERLAIDARALEPAESDRLIDFDRRVRFRHPLVRSALYRGATAQERREAHRALAEATDARVDPDRRAWHLAVATAGAERGCRHRARTRGRPRARTWRPGSRRRVPGASGRAHIRSIAPRTACPCRGADEVRGRRTR